MNPTIWRVAYLALVVVSLAVAGSASPVSANTSDSSATSGAFEVQRKLQARNELGPPADDYLWDQLICKGGKLNQMMNSDDATAGSLMEPPQNSAASRFRDWPRDFQTWNYRLGRDWLKSFDRTGYGLVEAFRQLGISSNREDWKFYKTTHGDLRDEAPDINTQTYIVNNRRYRATGAEYVTPMNSRNGAIIVAEQFSPANRARERRPPVSNLPELQRFSDILFGRWTLYADRAPIEHIITFGVTNRVTNAAIARALQEEGIRDIPDFPGECFNMDSEAGLALLGTPNGAGLAWMLIQHKAELGIQKIPYVCIYYTDSDLFYPRELASLYWEVTPA